MMLRPLISFEDVSSRHGRQQAIGLLCAMEELAKIKSDVVVSIDLGSRFEQALNALKNVNHSAAKTND